MAIAAVVALAVVALPLCALTAVGARRRGAGVAMAILGGLVFPLTWAIWYLRDERPYQHPAGHF
jgi:hypothetical protein